MKTQLQIFHSFYYRADASFSSAQRHLKPSKKTPPSLKTNTHSCKTPNACFHLLFFCIFSQEGMISNLTMWLWKRVYCKQCIGAQGWKQLPRGCLTVLHAQVHAELHFLLNCRPTGKEKIVRNWDHVLLCAFQRSYSIASINMCLKGLLT